MNKYLSVLIKLKKRYLNVLKNTREVNYWGSVKRIYKNLILRFKSMNLKRYKIYLKNFFSLKNVLVMAIITFQLLAIKFLFTNLTAVFICIGLYFVSIFGLVITLYYQHDHIEQEETF
jgi:hypothetical protein